MKMNFNRILETALAVALGFVIADAVQGALNKKKEGEFEADY